MSGRERLRRLAPPFVLLLAVVALARSWPVAARFVPADDAALVAMLLRAAEWAAGAQLVVSLLDVLVWYGLVERRAGRPAPRLLRDVGAALVWVAAACLVAAEVFGWPVAGIVTTSGVAVAVLGFALRDVLAALFAGLALNAERPYRIGDWIEFEPHPPGRVVEVGWLTTRAVTRDGVGLVLPNALLARAAFRNYSRPEPAFRDMLAVTLDHEAAPEWVERVLLAAAVEVEEVGPPLPVPDVKIAEFGPRGIVWQLSYWITDYAALPETRYRVKRAVLRHLHQAGLALSYAKLDLFHAEMPPRNLGPDGRDEVRLGRCGLFGELEPAELGALAAAARRHRLPAGSVLLREGEPGSSLYLVVEGVVEVWRERPDGRREHLNTIGAGGTLGEFSLLTGEPRSATVSVTRDAVLLEIGREALAPVLARRPELSDALGRTLAERQARTAAVSAFPATGPRAQIADGARLGRRIRAFFGL